MAEKLENGGDPTSEEFNKGPTIGEQIPDFSLPDQNGDTFHYRAGDHQKSLILFHRSATW
jgi:peroxiredoxin